jgi:hypothetical protein
MELTNLQGAYNQSQLTVKELRTKLEEQQSLFTIKTKEFEAKSKVSIQVCQTYSTYTYINILIIAAYTVAISY